MEKNVEIISEEEYKKMRKKAKRIAILLAIVTTIIFLLLFLYTYYIKHETLILSLVPALGIMIIGYIYAAFMYYKGALKLD